MKYIKGLDTLRAFAVLTVIYEHWGPLRFNQPWLKFIFRNMIPGGKFGVDIFFVLSGYLITRILLEARKQQPEERTRIIKSFYLRRMLRIFPMYFLLILVTAYLLKDTYVQSHIGYYLTYTSNFLFFKEGDWNSLPHTWSLAVEEQFYIVWPWLLIYTPVKYIRHLVIAFITMGVISSVVLYYAYGEFGNYLLTPCFSAFGIGAYYAYMQVYGLPERRLISALKILFPVCVVLLFIHQAFYAWSLIRVADAVIGLGCIVFIVNHNYGPVWERILQNKFLVWVGKISYGIYLIHFSLRLYYAPFINYLQSKSILSASAAKVLNYIPLAYCINFGLLLLICGFCYRFIETPFLNLKKYFTYGSGKKTTSLSPAALPGNHPA